MRTLLVTGVLGLILGLGVSACSDANAQGLGGPGLRSASCGPSSHAAQNMTATSITTSESSGSAQGVTLNGSRLGFNGASSTTFALGSASALSVYVSGSEAFAVTSAGVQSVGAGRYVQSSATGTGAPTASDCDADSEKGRLYTETTNFRLYVCMGASRGWDYVALTN